jgi:hypothetical protein
MFVFDANVARNYTSVMENYMKKCKAATKADFFYKFETVMSVGGIPVAKVIVDGDLVQILPVGERERNEHE